VVAGALASRSYSYGYPAYSYGYNYPAYGYARPMDTMVATTRRVATMRAAITATDRPLATALEEERPGRKAEKRHGYVPTRNCGFREELA
jgi:hypothetical protein